MNNFTFSVKLFKKFATAIFSLSLIGTCSFCGTTREINLISQCDKYNFTPSARKPGTRDVCHEKWHCHVVQIRFF